MEHLSLSTKVFSTLAGLKRTLTNKHRSRHLKGQIKLEIEVVRKPSLLQILEYRLRVKRNLSLRSSLYKEIRPESRP